MATGTGYLLAANNFSDEDGVIVIDDFASRMACPAVAFSRQAPGKRPPQIKATFTLNATHLLTFDTCDLYIFTSKAKALQLHKGVLIL